MIKMLAGVAARLTYRVAFGRWLEDAVPAPDQGHGHFVVVQKYNGTSDDRIFSVRPTQTLAEEDALIARGDKDPFLREVVVVHVV